MDLPEYQRRKLLTDQPGTLTPQQYNEAMAVARQLPFLRVEKAFFKCRGEKHIVTGSLVQFVVKARVIPPGTVNIPPVKPEDLEDIDPDEDGSDSRKPASRGKARGVQKVDATEIDRDVVPPLAYAPYFARDHSPRWHLFLSETKQNRVAVPPSTFSTFDQPIFDEQGKPTFNVQTFKLQFQAPPSEGSYTFRMNFICDSYIGADTKMEATLVIEDPSKAEDIESEEEISEPDEGIYYSSPLSLSPFLLYLENLDLLVLCMNKC
jgi:translocation protein SEC63